MEAIGTEQLRPRGFVRSYPFSSLCLVAAIVALTFAHSPAPAADPSAVRIADASNPLSPYADWPDQGMRPVPNLQEQRDDITQYQAALINAAYGGYGWRIGEHCCAGCPQCIHKHATPSNTHHYGGYYVGGGVPFFGEGRYLDEGTFGWDYHGITFEKHVALHWSHSRYQGGTGAYKTDGPKLKH